MKQRATRYTIDCIICPQCVEVLTRDDVEGFCHCPYCNHSFELEEELEDFLLQPIIEHWMRQSRSRSVQVLDDISGS